MVDEAQWCKYMTSTTRALNNWLEMWLNLVIWTTTTVTRIVARDDAHKFSTSCENFTPKKVTQLFLTVSGPNLLYKILFLRNRNRISEGSGFGGLAGWGAEEAAGSGWSTSSVASGQ